MAEIINLRRARKQKARAEAGQKAALQRRAGGRSKAERKLSAALEEKARKELDGHRRDPTE
jgi:hypothetical protein